MTPAKKSRCAQLHTQAARANIEKYVCVPTKSSRLRKKIRKALSKEEYIVKMVETDISQVGKAVRKSSTEEEAIKTKNSHHKTEKTEDRKSFEGFKFERIEIDEKLKKNCENKKLTHKKKEKTVKLGENARKEFPKVRTRSVQRLTPQKITRRGGGLQKMNKSQEKNDKKVPLLIKMFEKLQGASEGTIKIQPKVENLNPPYRTSSNFEVKSTSSLEPSQKSKVKNSSQNSIKSYFLSSNHATNKEPDVRTTTNQKPS